MGRFIIAAAIAGLALATAGPVTAQSRGITGRPAPAWRVDAWENLDEDQLALDLSDLAGKVIYLYCFQSWCPGCHSHGFPTMKLVHDRFAENPDVAFVAIQTVFEGQSTNTQARGRETLESFELDIPYGHAPGDHGSVPPIMRAYRTGGTPWTIVIGRDGVVRFDGFRIESANATALVERLLAESVTDEADANAPADGRGE